MKLLRIVIYVVLGIIGLLGIFALLIWLKVIPIQTAGPGDYSRLPDSKSSFAQQIQNSTVPESATQDKANFAQQLETQSGTRAETSQQYESEKSQFLETLAR